MGTVEIISCMRNEHGKMKSAATRLCKSAAFVFTYSILTTLPSGAVSQFC
jgi:hypothetical protein